MKRKAMTNMNPGGHRPVDRRAYDIYVRSSSVERARLTILGKVLEKAMKDLVAEANRASAAMQQCNNALEIHMLECLYNDASAENLNAKDDGYGNDSADACVVE